MAQLVEQRLPIGKDAYGRWVTAARKRTYDGKVIWEIKSEPVNQRDEGERMSGLTDDNIRGLLEAIALIQDL